MSVHGEDLKKSLIRDMHNGSVASSLSLKKLFFFKFSIHFVYGGIFVLKMY